MNELRPQLKPPRKSRGGKARRRAQPTGTRRILRRLFKRRLPYMTVCWVAIAIYIALLIPLLVMEGAGIRPIGAAAALSAFMTGAFDFPFIGLPFVLAPSLQFLPWYILRRRLAKAGFDKEDVNGAAFLAGTVHGPAVLLWRIPSADFLAGVPIDPRKHGWSFVRLLHRYQYRNRMPADGSDPPALRAERRGRNGWINSILVVGFLFAIPTASGLANIRERTAEGEWLSVRVLMIESEFAKLSEARQQRVLEVALRRAEQVLAASPADRRALEIAALAAERLGDSEAAEGYRQREARARGVPVPAAAPEPEAGP